MLKTARVVRDHGQSGSLNAMIAVWGFIDEHTFLTKAGDLGLVFQLQGVDFEGLDEGARRTVAHSFEAAIRCLDDQFRVYQYLVRRRLPEAQVPTCGDRVVSRALHDRADYLNGRRTNIFTTSLFLVLLYQCPRTTPRLLGNSEPGVSRWMTPLKSLSNKLSVSRQLILLSADVDRRTAHLQHAADAFAVHLGDSVRPQRLCKADVFGFLRSLANYSPERAAAVPLTYDTHVDHFMADSAIECHRNHLNIEGTNVRVLTMKEPPAHTFANLLAPLYALPGEFIACLEWRRIAAERMRRDLTMRRRHFFNKRVSLVNYVSPDTKSDEMLVDESAGAVVKQLGDALTEIEVNGHFFGECSLTLVLFDRDPHALAKSAGEANKLFGSHDGSFVEETYNLLNAWLAVIPGNYAHNLRRLALLETNYADLSFLFTHDQGEPTSPHLGRNALAVLETRHQTPYHFNLHVGDVGHTLVLGATGSGKSFLLNFLITHAQQYEPFTVVFDLGHSYRKLARLLAGSYLELGLNQRDVTINPFALDDRPEHLHFLHSFTRVLIEGRDREQLSEPEDRELYESIQSLYVLERNQRRLSTLAALLPRSLATRLERWIDGGRYASMFDNIDDTVSIRSFQVLALDDMEGYPELLEPLLFYAVHRVTAEIQHPARGARLKLGVLDEAWRFIQHPRLRAYVQQALKTWRKHNAAMLLATQSVDDFASADLLRTVVEGCPTKLLLANPSLDAAQYRALFQLNEAELELALSLVPRKEFLLKRQHLSKVLALNVDPKSHWLYTNTPMENARLASAIEQYGFEAALDLLAKEH